MDRLNIITKPNPYYKIEQEEAKKSARRGWILWHGSQGTLRFNRPDRGTKKDKKLAKKLAIIHRLKNNGEWKDARLHKS
jgi:hypothetical protein